MPKWVKFTLIAHGVGAAALIAQFLPLIIMIIR